MPIREHLEHLQTIKDAEARQAFLRKLAKGLYAEAERANLGTSEMLIFIGFFLECINDDLRSQKSPKEETHDASQKP